MSVANALPNAAVVCKVLLGQFQSGELKKDCTLSFERIDMATIPSRMNDPNLLCRSDNFGSQINGKSGHGSP
ncbi:hypothetical protein D3C85_1605080 [compost metagenome]